jgi:glutathione synthase/RimK-type ligase-like ATP-grasp enzyme
VTSASVCRSLIVGNVTDPHVELVLRELPPEGTVVVDAQTVVAATVMCTVDRWLLQDLTGSTVRIAHGATKGWIRRFAPPGWDEDVVIGSHGAAVLTAQLALLGALMRDTRVTWLTGSDALAAAENKLVQYATARQLAIRYPRTVVTRRVSDIVNELGETFVIKPLGVGRFDDKVVFSESIRAENLEGADLSRAPFLMQEQVAARRHLRVVTVGDFAQVCDLDATGLPLDWRQDEQAHHAFVHTEAFPEVAALASTLAAAAHVGYSSQDWIVGDDGPCFIDLNPAGQWAFLPEPVGSRVTQALAAWLHER